MSILQKVLKFCKTKQSSDNDSLELFQVEQLSAS
jgi:hypothetical protein